MIVTGGGGTHLNSHQSGVLKYFSANLFHEVYITTKCYDKDQQL